VGGVGWGGGGGGGGGGGVIAELPYCIKNPMVNSNACCKSYADALYTAGAQEISIDQSGFSWRKKLYCPDARLTSQERR